MRYPMRSYNGRELAVGRLRPEHMTALTLYFQACEGLQVDGACGPATRAALRELVSPLAVHALEDAGANREELAVPARARAWCAWAVCRWLRRAGLPAPGAGSRDELVAKRLLRWLLERGTVVWEPGADAGRMPLRPGDVVCWHRRRTGGWQGHIEVVTARTGRGVHFVGGNVRGQVRVSTFTEDEWQTRLRGVYGAVRPQAA